MYPKLRSDVYFRPIENGLLIGVDGEYKQLEGTNLYTLMERLSPLLDGEHTLEAITSSLSPEKALRVTSFVNVLLELEVVRDKTLDRRYKPLLPNIPTYTSSIEYLETLCKDAYCRFQVVRNSQVVVVGYGSAVLTLAPALWEAGVKHGHVLVIDDSTDTTLLGRRLAQHLEFDPEVDWRFSHHSRSVDSNFLYQMEQISAQADLIIAVGLPDFIIEMERFCHATKITLLPVIYSKAFTTIGPIAITENMYVSTDDSGCLRCALERVNYEAPTSDTITAWAMAGARSAFEAFKLLAELPTSCEGKLVRIDGGDLTDTIHKIACTGLSTTCRQVLLTSLGLCQRAIYQSKNADAVLPEKIVQHIDPFSGLLASVDPEDLPQLPLCLWVARGRGANQAPLILPGKTHVATQVRAIMAGLAAELPTAPTEDNLAACLIDIEQAIIVPSEKPSSDLIWQLSAGSSVLECVGTGMLALWAREMTLNTSLITTLDAEALDRHLDNDASFWWKTLDLRYGLNKEVELWHEPHHGLSMAQVTLNGEAWPITPGRTPAEALKTAIMKALADVQSGVWKGGALVSLLSIESCIIFVEPSEHESLSWEDWLVQSCHRGYLMVPFEYRSLMSHGIIVGWVGMTSTQLKPSGR